MEWKTRVTELLDINYPIVQGGLAHLAYADLAAAVSNAGGLGQITAMSLSSPYQLRKGIDRKSTRLNSSHVASSYAVFRLKKKTGREQARHGQKHTKQLAQSP